MLINKTISKIVVLATLFIFGVYLSYTHVTRFGFGFFSFTSTGLSVDTTNTNSGELLVGNTIKGEFKSTYPNLGIVAVRFNNRYRDSDDTLSFRIKEVGESAWYYESKYSSNQFLPEELFPFGFPKITNSLNKNYLFEIESLSGASGSSIYIGDSKPTFISVYFADRVGLSLNKYHFAKFCLSKIKNIIEQENSLQSIFVFFSPLISYLLYLSLNGSSYHFLLALSFISIAWDIFYIERVSDIFTLSVIMLIALQIKKYRYQPILFSYSSLALLVLSYITSIAGLSLYTEKAASWTFLLIFVSTVLSLQNKKPYSQMKNSLVKMRQDIVYPKFKIHPVFERIITIFYKPSIFAFVFLIIYKTFLVIETTHKKYITFFPEAKLYPVMTKYYFIIAIFFTFFLWATLSRKINHVVLLIVIYFFVRLYSNNFLLFQYTPKVLSISPSTTSEAWVDVTITGKNFQDLPFVGKVTLAGQVQWENVWYWSNEKIIFRTNPHTTKTGEVCVITHSKGNSNCLPFTYNFGKK